MSFFSAKSTISLSRVSFKNYGFNYNVCNSSGVLDISRCFLTLCREMLFNFLFPFCSSGLILSYRRSGLILSYRKIPRELSHVQHIALHRLALQFQLLNQLLFLASSEPSVATIIFLKILLFIPNSSFSFRFSILFIDITPYIEAGLINKQLILS